MESTRIPGREPGGGSGAQWRLWLAGMLLTLTCGTQGASADDLSYLDALEAEADRLELLSDAERMDGEAEVAAVASTRPGAVPSAPGRTELPAGLSREQFEAVLVHYRGTYMLYEKLSESARVRVFDAYNQDNRIAEIRRRVVELL